MTEGMKKMREKRKKKQNGEKKNRYQYYTASYQVSKTPGNNLLNGIIARILKTNPNYIMSISVCIMKILFFAINWLLDERVKAF